MLFYLATLLFALSLSCPTEATAKVLVSGYNENIEVFEVHNGVLNSTGTWKVDANLTWIQQINNSFYAIHEVSNFQGLEGGAISRWELQNNSLIRKEILSLGKGNTGPAHLLVDLEHNLAFTANYASGSVTVISLNANGTLNKVKESFAYNCGSVSHPHEVIRHGNIIWVTDLGCDMIYHYRVKKDNSSIEQIGHTSLEKGYGPRHLVLHPRLDLAFLVCELTDILISFEVNYSDASLRIIEEMNYSSTQNNTGAEVLLDEAGQFLYVSSRGVGTVSVFKLMGRILVPVEEYLLKGTWPRSIAKKDGGLLAIDQMGDKLEVLRVDPMTGKLNSTSVVSTQHQPALVMFLNGV